MSHTRTASLIGIIPLLPETIAACMRHKRHLLYGVVLGSILLYVMSALCVWTIMPSVLRVPPPPEISSKQEYDALRARADAGDRMAAMKQKRIDGLMIARERAIEEAALTIMPIVGLFMLLTFLLTTWMIGYTLILLAHPTAAFLSVLKRSWNMLLPFIAQRVWIGIRTFVWLPIVIFFMMSFTLSFVTTSTMFVDGIRLLLLVIAGLATILLGAILYPRFFLAPVLLATEKYGIVSGTRESFRRSHGHWGKIIGNALIYWLMVNLGFFAIVQTIGILGFLPFVVIIFPYFLFSLEIIAIFLTMLTRSIIGHASAH